MAITREAVLQSIPNDAHRLDGVTEAQWAEYLRLLDNYFSGQSAPLGWQFLIESVMQQHGATPDQAFVLAAARHEYEDRI